MRRLRWILLVALAALLSTSDTTSAFKSVKGPASRGPKDSTTGPKSWHSDDRRLLRSVINSPKPDDVDEERAGVISMLLGKFKFEYIVRKLFLHYADWRKNKFLRKMDEMYKAGMTPENLDGLYGPTKKLTLQRDFRKYYKWKKSWATQREYPQPGTVKRVLE
ncbi:hypothetical protein PR003_g16584 [Phytophthora rubi]|uniref:RxLR effector protein n=1 Tax=Phytophthora rubi TaxID=129364 RepID=A0A6A4EJC3_9STRA|nr:hypothetical protein PR003_g16584 [Phytophthora rubi]